MKKILLGLLIGISFLLVGCENEQTLSHEQQQEFDRVYYELNNAKDDTQLWSKATLNAVDFVTLDLSGDDISRSVAFNTPISRWELNKDPQNNAMWIYAFHDTSRTFRMPTPTPGTNLQEYEQEDPVKSEIEKTNSEPASSSQSFTITRQINQLKDELLSLEGNHISVVPNMRLNDGSYVANISLDFNSRSTADARSIIEFDTNNLAVRLGMEDTNVSRINITVSAPNITNDIVARLSWDRSTTDTSRIILDSSEFWGI